VAAAATAAAAAIRQGRPGEAGQLPGAWVWCEEEGGVGFGGGELP